MNASEMTFGIEIETIAPHSAIRDHGLEIGSYHHGRQVPYLPAGWMAKSDGSLRTTGSGLGCEIVSPVLRGEAGIRQVLEVVKTLAENGHQVNASCGVHVHVGWDPAWEPKTATGGWAKKGPGQSETERLMGYLAWGAGYARIHNGQQYGWICDAIPQDEVKAEFRRLARKYDAMA